MLKRNVNDSRRTIEIEKRLGIMKQFDSVPAVGQLKDGEYGIVKDTGQVVVRQGNSLYTATFTLVS